MYRVRLTARPTEYLHILRNRTGILWTFSLHHMTYEPLARFLWIVSTINQIYTPPKFPFGAPFYDFFNSIILLRPHSAWRALTLPVPTLEVLPTCYLHLWIVVFLFAVGVNNNNNNNKRLCKEEPQILLHSNQWRPDQLYRWNSE